MKEEESSLREEFIAAYPRYVAELVTSRGVKVDATIADAIVEGVGVLDGLLRHLEKTPIAEQRMSPLEAFREALRPVDRALALVGVPVPQGVGGARALAPWDHYALSPGSSKVLGGTAHDAHLKWGITKARAMAKLVDVTAGPALGMFVPDDDRTSIVAQAERASYRSVVLPSHTPVSVAVVSADERGANDVVQSASQTARVIVYGEAIDDIDHIRFMSLGAAATVSRDQVMNRLAEVLPPLV